MISGILVTYLVPLRVDDSLSGTLLGVQEERVCKVFLIRMRVGSGYQGPLDEPG